MSRRAGLYLRISEDRSNDGLAVDRQRQDGLNLIKQRGWTLAGEFVDNDTSAAGRKRRPGFDSLIDAINEGRIDTIVALSMDRLSRNRRDDLRIVETCMPKRVLLALVKGSDIDMSSAAGRFIADVLAGLARVEIEVKGERHRRQIQQAAEAGKPAGARRAFGYRKGGLEIEPEEAKAVAELYRRWLAGAGVGELADWLNRSGFSTTTGLRWRESSVKVVLANPRNAGIRGMRPVVDEATGRRAQYHVEVAKAVWPAIVPDETWRAAVEKMKTANRPGRHVAYTSSPRYLLSGVALCGQCGRHMISTVTGSGARAYECTTKRHIVRRAVPIDEFVQYACINRLRQPDAVDLLFPVAGGKPLEDLRGEAMAKRERLRNLTVDYAEGLIDREQLQAGTARLRQRLGEIDSEIAAAGQVDVLAPLVLAEDFSAASAVWGGYAVSERQAVLRRVMRIVVRRGRPGRPPVGASFDASSMELTLLGAGG